MTNVSNEATGEAVPTELTAADMREMLRRLHEAQEARKAEDPMLSTIQLFQTERARYNAADDRDEDVDGAVYNWLYDELMSRTPEVGSEEGAIAALRLVADDMEHSGGGFQIPLVAAALNYMRRTRC